MPAGSGTIYDVIMLRSAFRKLQNKVFLPLIVFASCASLPLVSDEQLNNMGSEAFDEIKSQTPVERDRRINDYVLCITHNLLEVTDDPTGVREWEIVVFRDQNVNAFALPGGKIGVFTGLLSVAENQHQLAAVIGHEIAHVTARHAKERVTQNMIAQGGLSVAEMVLGDNPAAMGALGLGTQFGVLLPFSRKHENEADEIGLELMAKAGFNPRESVSLWENMMAAAEAAGSNQPPEFMSTHPAGDTRIRRLEGQMGDALILQEIARRNGKNPNCSL